MHPSHLHCLVLAAVKGFTPGTHFSAMSALLDCWPMLQALQTTPEPGSLGWVGLKALCCLGIWMIPGNEQIATIGICAWLCSNWGWRWSHFPLKYMVVHSQWVLHVEGRCHIGQYLALETTDSLLGVYFIRPLKVLEPSCLNSDVPFWPVVQVQPTVISAVQMKQGTEKRHRRADN